MDGTSQFERFIAAVHRRMMLLRGLERVGLCVLGGCAVSLILMPILIWRGQGVWELLAVTLGAAAVAGAAWGIAARPTKLAAAMEADRQLKLSDLLGTALTLRQQQQGGLDDALNETVLAMAEARCRQASPSTVMLHRLGARGWSGIGLAAALVAGLALLGGGQRNRAEARAEQPKSWQDLERAQDAGNHSQFASAPDLRRSAPGAGTDDDDPHQSSESQTEQAAGGKTPKAASANGAGAADAGNGNGNAGTGHSISKGHTEPARDPITGGNVKANGGPAKTAGGGGAASDDGQAGESSGGAAASAARRRQAAPVWQSDAWPVDREGARAAIRGGRVPDAYRDLVRDYFERE